MSLFRLRGSAPATPASRPFTRLTVRLPKTVPEARVVALHAGYGETVAQGAVVMTLRVGPTRRTVEAPRTGKVLPMAGPGDELVAGDALYALHLEEPVDGAVAGALSEETGDAAPAGTSLGGRRQAQAGRATAERRRVPVLRRGTAQPSRSDSGEALVHPSHVSAEEEPEPRGRLGALARVLLALGLFAAGVVLLLPLLIELGFGTSDEARLAVTIAALALGLLVWRLLARGAGRLAGLGVGLLGAGWAALVMLTLIGINPLPIGPMALPDTHALAPANRTRVPPPRAAAAPPSAFSGIRTESSAGAPPPAQVEPEARVRFSALPTERFALVPMPGAPPAVVAGHEIARIPAPAEGSPPAASAALTDVPAGIDAAAPGRAAQAAPPATFDRTAQEMLAAAPPRPAAAGGGGYASGDAPGTGDAPAAGDAASPPPILRAPQQVAGGADPPAPATAPRRPSAPATADGPPIVRDSRGSDEPLEPPSAGGAARSGPAAADALAADQPGPPLPPRWLPEAGDPPGAAAVPHTEAAGR